MKEIELLKYLEDKKINISNDWFYHATDDDLNIIKKILSEGIKCAYLRERNGSHFNGRYYISLAKANDKNSKLSLWLRPKPKFIIDGIDPYFTKRNKMTTRKLFIDTRIPLRTSEWDGEYQQYYKIDVDKFVGFEYPLEYLLKNDKYFDFKRQLIFLKKIVLFLKELNIDLSMYDFSSDCEINKQKLLSLKLS